MQCKPLDSGQNVKLFDVPSLSSLWCPVSGVCGQDCEVLWTDLHQIWNIASPYLALIIADLGLQPLLMLHVLMPKFVETVTIPGMENTVVPFFVLLRFRSYGTRV